MPCLTIPGRACYLRPMPDLDIRTVGDVWNRSIQDGLPWAQETCGERASQLTILLARSRRTFPSGSLVSLTVVMRQRLEAEAYLTRLKDGRSVRLLNITKLAAWETGYEHWISSVVRTGRQY